MLGEFGYFLDRVVLQFCGILELFGKAYLFIVWVLVVLVSHFGAFHI